VRIVRRERRQAAALAVALPALASAAAGQQPAARWSVEVYAGASWSARTRLRIRQSGEPDLAFTARYETRPFRDSPYYAYRFGRWAGDRAWEAELVHHKLYLTRPPPEVQHFEVTHGYNLLTVNHAARSRDDGWVARVGVGVVIAHPEGVVRGRPIASARTVLGRGYHVAGFTAQVAVGRRVELARHLFLSPEAKATASLARMSTADGRLVVPNVAVHALAGLGYIFVGR